jgi:ribosomal protein S18 acetylase RimI-like enzyme
MPAIPTTAMTTNATTPTTTPEPAVTWEHVVDEIAWSCSRRAPAGDLLHQPGVVGVLAGPAPVIWVYGDTSAPDLLETLDRSPAVDDVYVASDRPELIDRLTGNGWCRGERAVQFARRTGRVVDVTDMGLKTRSLGQIDLAPWRFALMTWGGLSPALAAAAYPDDFFDAAGPVEVLAAYDEDGILIGTIGRRDQHLSAMLFGLAVAPAWRNRGVACWLVRAAIESAGRDGAEFVHAQAGLAGVGVLGRCGFAALGGWQPLSRASEAD